MKRLFEKLMRRWDVETYGQALLILFIFAISGMTILVIRQFVFDWLGLTAETAMWLKVAAWILLIIPVYQLVFLGYGFLFGQFDFVWKFEKNSLGRIKSLFVSESTDKL